MCSGNVTRTAAPGQDRVGKLCSPCTPSLPTARPTRRARVVDLNGRGTLVRGSYADVTIFDPRKRGTFEAAKSHSKSHNTPFDGWQLTGKVVATVVGGKIVYRAD